MSYSKLLFRAVFLLCFIFVCIPATLSHAFTPWDSSPEDVPLDYTTTTIPPSWYFHQISNSWIEIRIAGESENIDFDLGVQFLVPDGDASDPDDWVFYGSFRITVPAGGCIPDNEDCWNYIPIAISHDDLEYGGITIGDTHFEQKRICAGGDYLFEEMYCFWNETSPECSGSGTPRDLDAAETLDYYWHDANSRPCGKYMDYTSDSWTSTALLVKPADEWFAMTDAHPNMQSAEVFDGIRLVRDDTGNHPSVDFEVIRLLLNGYYAMNFEGTLGNPSGHYTFLKNTTLDLTPAIKTCRLNWIFENLWAPGNGNNPYTKYPDSYYRDYRDACFPLGEFGLENHQVLENSFSDGPDCSVSPGCTNPVLNLAAADLLQAWDTPYAAQWVYDSDDGQYVPKHKAWCSEYSAYVFSKATSLPSLAEWSNRLSGRMDRLAVGDLRTFFALERTLYQSLRRLHLGTAFRCGQARILCRASSRQWRLLPRKSYYSTKFLFPLDHVHQMGGRRRPHRIP